MAAAGGRGKGAAMSLAPCSALLTPRPPELMVLNEPEASLHPSLMPLLADTAGRCRIVVVSHNGASIGALRSGSSIVEVRLHKNFGETTAPDLDAPRCVWPKR
jgi:predicted ATPase